MIKSCGKYAVVLLADDSLYSWDSSLSTISPERVIADPVAAFETWLVFDSIWVLTCELKLMIGEPSPGGLLNASEVMGIIADMRVRQAINEAFSVPVVDNLEKLLNEKVSDLHEYLERLKSQAGQRQPWYPGRLTLEEGCVYDLNPKSEPGVCPSKLIIGSNEHTHYIIAQENQIFFTTDSGLCYHLDMHTQPDDENKKPVLLQYLTDYFVENVFILSNYVVIQHDGSKLSLLLIKYEPVMRRFARALEGLPEEPVRGFIDLTYEQGETPIALPFFDDKDIISVSQTHAHIYFTTSTGQVYYCSSSDSMTDPKIELIPFFNDRPIAVKSTATGIRSARNIVKSHA